MDHVRIADSGPLVLPAMPFFRTLVRVYRKFGPNGPVTRRLREGPKSWRELRLVVYPVALLSVVAVGRVGPP